MQTIRRVPTPVLVKRCQESAAATAVTTVGVLVPLAAVVAAFTGTYFFCMRPMRRGHCAMDQAPRQQNQQAQHLEHERRAAREEPAELHRQRADAGAS